MSISYRPERFYPRGPRNVRVGNLFKLCVKGLGPIAGLSLLTDLAVAGAWTQPPGHFYTRIEAASFVTDRQYDSRGNQIFYAADLEGVRLATYRNRQVRAYAEYGLLPRVTTVASLAYQRLE